MRGSSAALHVVHLAVSAESHVLRTHEDEDRIGNDTDLLGELMPPAPRSMQRVVSLCGLPRSLSPVQSLFQGVFKSAFWSRFNALGPLCEQWLSCTCRQQDRTGMLTFTASSTRTNVCARAEVLVPVLSQRTAL